MANLSDSTNALWQFIDSGFTNTSLGHRLLHRLQFTNLRHVFYLITPNETMFESVDQVPNYNVKVSAWWLVIIAMEFIILKLSGHHDRFALNDSVTSVCAGMLSQCFKFGGRAIAIFPYIYIWTNFRIIENPWDSPWTWIFCLLFQDFLYYIGHRAVHEAGFLWGFHAIHHSSEYYNFSTALRQAALQDIPLAIYDIAQAFFIPPPVFLVHRYFNEIYQFTLHTSLFDVYGPLGLVLNTPSHHRVHHGRNPYCIDRNYGGVLIIWDKIFGTFEPERKDEPVVYGLIKREKNFNQIWLQFHILKELLLDKWRMKDENGVPIFRGIEKLKAVIFPPGYFPGVPVQKFFHWWTLKKSDYGVPQIESEIFKYNPDCHRWVKIYCTVHFLILLAVFFHFEFDRQQLSYINFTVKILYFIFTMQCFGEFFDKSIYAPYMELIRCTAVVGHYIQLMSVTARTTHSRIFMTSFFGLSAIFWGVYCSIKTCKTKDLTINQKKCKTTVHQIYKLNINVVSTGCFEIPAPKYIHY